VKKIFVFIICLLAFNVQAYEDNMSYAIDIGKSKDDIKIYRLGIQHDLSEWLHNKGFKFSGYFESSINYWKSINHDIYAIAFSPVFKFLQCQQCENTAYFEIGVGMSLISRKMIENRNLSSHFQFEDRIGIGYKYGDLDFHLRYMHYSNAGLAKPNDGIDIFIAGLAFRF
jgi:lipid A 3-O-deacylase